MWLGETCIFGDKRRLRQRNQGNNQGWNDKNEMKNPQKCDGLKIDLTGTRKKIGKEKKNTKLVINSV